jgi:dTMP kinase
VFVSFEGVDGSGKTTQAALLREMLRADGREVVATREPGGTALGEQVRSLLLDDGRVAPWAEAALFAAARAQLVTEVVRPALERGADVVCDRFVDSSLAYQGIARGLGLEAVLELNRVATGGLLPDRTFLLLLPAEEALRRAGDRPDRIEREGVGLLERVDSAYREVAARFPDRIVTIDARLPEEEVAQLVRDGLRGLSRNPIAGGTRAITRRLRTW